RITPRRTSRSDRVIRASLSAAPEEPAAPSETGQFLSALATVLVDGLMYGDEADERQVNPWFNLWRAQFGSDAKELRDLAARDAAEKLGLTRNITDLANALDEVASMRLYIGAGEKLEALTRKAVDQAGALKAELVDSRPIADEERRPQRRSSRYSGDW